MEILCLEIPWSVFLDIWTPKLKFIHSVRFPFHWFLVQYTSYVLFFHGSLARFTDFVFYCHNVKSFSDMFLRGYVDLIVICSFVLFLSEKHIHTQFLSTVFRSKIFCSFLRNLKICSLFEFYYTVRFCQLWKWYS